MPFIAWDTPQTTFYYMLSWLPPPIRNLVMWFLAMFVGRCQKLLKYCGVLPEPLNFDNRSRASSIQRDQARQGGGGGGATTNCPGKNLNGDTIRNRCDLPTELRNIEGNPPPPNTIQSYPRQRGVTPTDIKIQSYGRADANLPVKESCEATTYEDHVGELALLHGYTKAASEALVADLPTEIKVLEAVPPGHRAKLLQLELESAKQSAEQKAKNISARREMFANDPFLTMIRDIAVEQGYSKGALAVLMSDLPESMLDVKALPVKHHRLALGAEVKEAREAAESKAALNS